MPRFLLLAALLALLPVRPPAAAAPADRPAPVLVAAGDVASCGSRGDTATARLLGPRAAVALLGDGAYRAGSPREYARCYHPTWGRAKERTRPVPGNHDYNTPGAAGYFGYFGAAAGEPGAGYYAYGLGAWRVVALNSNCAEVGGCHAGSPQERWLRAELAAHPAACALAYWHHARFSSGAEHGGTAEVAPLWRALQDAGAEVVLSGHEHAYERFAPQDADGNADPARGIRQFVVGTGGAEPHAPGAPRPHSEARAAGTAGVLRLRLRPGGYKWRFVAVDGSAVDEGRGRCR